MMVLAFEVQGWAGRRRRRVSCLETRVL